MTPPSAVRDIRVLRLGPAHYGQLSVVSTENSGGGLPYFGVFSDEQIRTVYLDMRQRETDETPLWILEFAVPGNTAVHKKLASELDQGQPKDESQQGDETGQGDETEQGHETEQGDEAEQGG